MREYVGAFCAVLTAVLVVGAAGAAPTKYVFSQAGYVDAYDAGSVASGSVAGRFAGSDDDQDGLLELAELTDFVVETTIDGITGPVFGLSDLQSFSYNFDGSFDGITDLIYAEVQEDGAPEPDYFSIGTAFCALDTPCSQIGDFPVTYEAAASVQVLEAPAPGGAGELALGLVLLAASFGFAPPRAR